MKRSFLKIGLFFGSWSFLKLLIGIVFVVVFFYIEEDWRGAHAWAVAKAQWEAKGETFDYSKFFAPPVPDEQNLGALPLFKLEPAKDKDFFDDSYLAPLVLDRAMRGDLSTIEIPTLGNWMRGELPDMEKIHIGIAKDYSMAFGGEKPSGDSLAQFNGIYPFYSDFLEKAASRPLCRFNSDYTISPPMLRGFGLVTKQIKLSKIVTLHAVLALDDKQSEAALEDIKTNFKLLSGVKSDPTIIGGLVAIGIASITDAALYYGLSCHSWNDSQLLELEQTYEPINFLSEYQFALRSEAAESNSNLVYFKHADRSELYKLVHYAESYSIQAIKYSPPWPNGWWDNNMRQLAAYHFNDLATVDPKLRRVYPEVNRELTSQVKKEAARWDADAPWNCWYTLASSGETNLMEKFARGQVWIDEARIACALERYHLAKGIYPESLDSLVPVCIQETPNDIMNDQPYHFQLRADGTYLLYSVGWNQTDEGGKVIYQDYNPKALNDHEGDWVWPTPNLSTTTIR